MTYERQVIKREFELKIQGIFYRLKSATAFGDVNDIREQESQLTRVLQAALKEGFALTEVMMPNNGYEVVTLTDLSEEKEDGIFRSKSKF